MAGVVLAASASALSFATVASAQAAGGDLAAVEIGRFGAADRYSTSLRIAEAFVERAGGSVDNVVLVSGRHWHDAVIAAPQAARLGAPVVMTPPGELREDMLAFLKSVNAKEVHAVVSGVRPDTTISPAVIAALQEEGFTTLANPGGDRYAVSAWMADRLGTAGSLSRSGTSAIIANGEVFADALVAGPVAAKAQVPILLTPRDELHPAAERYLRDSGIAHVVLMGGTAALSEDVETAIRELGITRIDRMAGATRFETATDFARYAARTWAAGATETGCFDGSHVGLARGDVPFDSFSAAPLLAQSCAPLVLTRTDAVPDATAGYLDDARRSVSPGPVGVSVFGGDAAVSQSALDEYLATAPGSGADGTETDKPAIDCGGNSSDPPSQLISGTTFAREPAWSPDCSRIAYVHVGTLTIADADGGNAAAVWRTPGATLNQPVWSPDGTQIALSVLSFEGGTGYANQRRHIYVVDADGTDATKITEGTVEDDYPTWSPDGTRIAFHRTTWVDRSVSPPVGTDRYVVTMDHDGADQTALNKGGGWESHPAWSPDGTQFAVNISSRLGTMNADGTNLRSWNVDLHWSSKLSWSPDGTHIALARIAGPRDDPANVETNIAALEVATGNVTDITTIDGTELNPHWSPDSNRILFNTYADSGRNTHIWVVGTEHQPGP